MKTFYRPEMNVALNESFSPSAGKPKAFIEYLIANGNKVDLVSDFVPALPQEFALAHSWDMVEGILDLSAKNGFGTRSSEVARSLPFTTGSFLAAARYAVEHHENTFSPTSGFHHAGRNYCGGFCTFNGLMVSALAIMAANLVKKVGILDLDMHYGDGTQSILDYWKLKSITHYSFGERNVSQRYADQWIEGLEKELEQFLDCDVIFYQAGGDPHIDDPLGGVLTTEQMAKRDEIVFHTFRKAGIPVVWNLAGGYQKPLEKVLQLHETTYKFATGGIYE